MSLHMIQMALAPRQLHLWGREARISGEDRGYLIHAALRKAFGSAGPQPFLVEEKTGGRSIKLLGYSRHPASDLVQQQAAAEPLLAAVFPKDLILSKPMPDQWPGGRTFGFRVRCCPVVRRSDEQNRVSERDAFLATCLRHPEEPIDREEVYLDWLNQKVSRDGAASLVSAELRQFRLFTPVRRGQGRRPARLRDGGRRPEAIIEGKLKVENPDGFAGLLERGVGRHRAFGFGMLLLRPA